MARWTSRVYRSGQARAGMYSRVAPGSPLSPPKAPKEARVGDIRPAQGLFSTVLVGALHNLNVAGFVSMKAMAMRSGPGSVRPRGRGWEYYLDDRVKGGTGHQPRKGGFSTEREARLALALERSRLDRRRLAPGGPHRVADVAEAWLDDLAVKPTTKERYARDLRVHVLPTLGDRPVDEVTHGEVHELFGALRKGGGRSNANHGKALAYSTLCGIYTTVRQLHQWAVVRGIAPDSPLTGLDRRLFVGRERAATDLVHPLPVDLPHVLEALDEREQRDLIDALATWRGTKANRDGHQWREAWLIALATGLRLGELLGLADEHVDATNGVLHVRQQATCVAHQPRLSGPKSKKSVRDLAVGPPVLERKRRLRYQQGTNGDWPNHHLLFTHLDGRMPHPERFSREFRRFLQANGLRDVRFHALRHTWATRALEANTPLAVVSEHLGHANQLVTAATYQHVTHEFARATLAVEENILGGNPPSNP